MLKTRFSLVACLLAVLAPAAARADSIKLVAVGDSLAEPYAGHKGKLNPVTGFPYWGEAGDKSWSEQFQAVRPAQLAVINQARAGSTSAELISQGQHTAVADMVRAGKVSHAVMTVGTSDVMLAYGSDSAPHAFIPAFAANVNAAVQTISAAGKVGLVVGNIPNLALAPAIQVLAGNDPAALGMIRDMVRTANREIERVAAANNVPMVDLYRMSALALKPPTLAGVQLEGGHMFAPDLLHPSTIAQGLMANAILEALHRAYGVDISALRLSDQEILRLAGLKYDQVTPTYFDVSPYVIMPSTQDAPEPSTLALCAAAGLVGLGRWGYRRVRRA